MSALRFSKWEGTGNDFIVVDGESAAGNTWTKELVSRLCDRHFGIGSDGLIVIQGTKVEGVDYHMEFFNPDGSRSFCGNGSRCAFGQWSALHGNAERARFSAADGIHTAEFAGAGTIRISMKPPARVDALDERTDLLDTGSPHLVVWVDDPDAVDLLTEARPLRYDPRHAPGGVNVNYAAWRHGTLFMRTYERGVEGETLSCGTGVTAAALSAMLRGRGAGGEVDVSARGGRLRVEARSAPGHGLPNEVWLIGPAREVFTGQVAI